MAQGGIVYIDNWKVNELNALVTALGEENARKLAAGGKAKVVWEVAGESEIATITPKLASFFDVHGRFIPPKGTKGVVNPNKDFYLVQPEGFNPVWLAANFATVFDVTTPLTSSQLEAQIQELTAKLTADPLLVNVLKGIHLPLILPKLEVGEKDFDYGRTLEGVFLAAVERAYKAQFSGRTFTNHRKGTLEGQVTIEPDARHDILVERMKQGPQVVLYFPDALRGFSIGADREMIKRLPEGFALAGAIDTAMAVALYPSVLARDFHTPGLDCAAVSWGLNSFYFKAHAAGLDFVHGGLGAVDSCSGGLVFLG